MKYIQYNRYIGNHRKAPTSLNVYHSPQSPPPFSSTPLPPAFASSASPPRWHTSPWPGVSRSIPAPWQTCRNRYSVGGFGPPPPEPLACPADGGARSGPKVRSVLRPSSGISPPENILRALPEGRIPGRSW